MKPLKNMKNVVIIFNGTKTIQGQDTGQRCKIIGVSQKEDIENLQYEDIIPPILETGELTDVIIFPKIQAITLRTLKYRPFQAGVSIGPSDLSSAGTVGTFVVDNIDQQVCLLTCNHVLGPFYDFLGPKPANGLLDPYSTYITQPGVYDRANPIYERVGIGKRTINIDFRPTETNFIDAVIGSFNINNVYAPGIMDLLYPAAFPFGSKFEYVPGTIVYKSGRSTLLTNGVIQSIDVEINVNYIDTIAHFTDQIMIFSESGFSTSGDSGSVILFKSGGRYRIAGLLFAGTEDGKYGFANHITDIEDFLNVSEWDGSMALDLGEDDFLKINRICYSKSLTRSLRHIDNTPSTSYNSCGECLSSQNRKTLLGNLT
jgi:hypothetical protein